MVLSMSSYRDYRYVVVSDSYNPPRRFHRQSIAESARFSVASSSLGRFSKSTSRLANDHEREEQFRSTQTLPRSLHSGGHARSQVQRRQQQPPVCCGAIKYGTPSGTRSRHYGSMINISIKNTVTSPKVAAQPPPAKPERTYKSSLSRSKSFNVEAARNGVDATSPRIPYTSNLQLNRLDETPPLKSPGILASINRSHRDSPNNARHEY